jgi:hypothetical protein
MSDLGAATREWASGILRGMRPGATRSPLRRPARILSARGLTRVCVRAAGVAAALSAVAIVALFALLASGPIDLQSLNPSLTRSLEDRLGPGYHVSIGSTFLTGGANGLGLGFGAFEIRDAAGRTLVAAPGGRLGLDAIALLTFDVKVRRLELEGLTLELRVRPDGAVSVAAASAAKDVASLQLTPPVGGSVVGGNPGLLAAGLIDALTGGDQALSRVSLVNGRLDVENEALNKTSVYKNLAIAFGKDGDAAKIKVSAEGPSGNWSVEAAARGGSNRTLDVDARGLGLDDLLLLDTHPPPFFSDMPISFMFESALTPAGGMRALTGEFSLGAGHFKLDDPDHRPFLVDEATGRVAWDPENARYRLDRLEALAGASHFHVDGWLAPPAGDDHAWRAHLQSADSVLAPERAGDEPVVIDDAQFDAHFLPAESRFVVDRYALHGPHLTAEMSAEAAAVPDGSTLKLDVRVGESGLAEIMRIWPSFINPDARNWCLEHIRGGEIAAGTMKVDWDAAGVDAAKHKRAVPPDSVHGEFAMKDAAVDLLPGVPTVTGLDVVGLITGRVFSVASKHGQIEFASGRRLLASDVYFKIPDTSPAPLVASQGGAHVQGAADALAELLSRDAVKRYAGFSVEPSTVKGQFQGQLTIDLGLGKAARPEDLRFRAEGALSNLQLDKFLANERFEQGALEVVAEAGNLKITGQGLINGLPAKVDLAKGADDDGALTLNFTLDDAARAKLGLAGGPPMTGPMPVRLKAPLNKSGADVDVDLTRVEIDSIEGAPLKAAGKPGKATFTVKPSGDSIAIGSLAIDAGSISARGAAQFAADGALQSARITQLRLTALDDLKLDLQGGAPMKATIRGVSLDARGLIKTLLSHDPNTGAGRDLDVDVRIGAVIGANKQTVGGFELLASRRGGVMRTLQAKGRLGDGGFTARKDESGLMTVRADDAGAFAKFLDVYTKMEGGLLDLTLKDGRDDVRGAALLRKFTLRDEPALRRMAAASPTPPDRRELAAPVITNIEADAVKFDRMTADFTRSAGRLDVSEAVIFNSEVGLTTKGYIDYARDRVDLNGTFVPAYQLNNIVSHIPVFGFLLGGGQHEGIFGVNYRVTGAWSSPTLTVNPLSGMTPGILRKLFGVVDGTTPPPDAYAPQQ